MADQLDMSETYVGQMERDQKPIERRTELAVRYLGLTPASRLSWYLP